MTILRIVKSALKLLEIDESFASYHLIFAYNVQTVREVCFGVSERVVRAVEHASFYCAKGRCQGYKLFTSLAESAQEDPVQDLGSPLSVSQLPGPRNKESGVMTGSSNETTSLCAGGVFLVVRGIKTTEDKCRPGGRPNSAKHCHIESSSSRICRSPQKKPHIEPFIGARCTQRQLAS